jgi:hypothetical protein
MSVPNVRANSEFHRVRIKARFGQSQMQEVCHLIAVFREEFGRHRNAVHVRGEANPCRQIVARGGKALRVHIARAFFDQRGHQVDRPALAGRIQ